MKHKLSGQITLETAIVMPIVMIVIATFMSISLYVHDVMAIKSYTYALAMEYKDENLSKFKENVLGKIAQIPLFVMSVKAECSQENDSYKVTVYPKSKGNAGGIKLFFDKGNAVTVEVQKNIDTEVMYAFRAVLDEIE